MSNEKDENDKKSKYFVNIEGTEFPWDSETITTTQIAELGGWDLSQGVVEVDKDNNEITLDPNAVITLKPGHGFAKKHKWKRGLLAERIIAELDLLRRSFGEVSYQKVGEEHWFEVAEYTLSPGWKLQGTPTEKIRVAFRIVTSLSAAPYGFLIPHGMSYEGKEPGTADAPVTVPFAGQWRMLSWSPEAWVPTTDIHNGSNLLAWCRSFRQRMMEGA